VELEAEDSALSLDVTEGGVVANLGCDKEVVGVMRGTSPTGTVLRKCVRGTPRASTSGRSGSSMGCAAWGSERWISLSSSISLGMISLSDTYQVRNASHDRKKMARNSYHLGGQ
jgi:hypothetical protein